MSEIQYQVFIAWDDNNPKPGQIIYEEGLTTRWVSIANWERSSGFAICPFPSHRFIFKQPQLEIEHTPICTDTEEKLVDITCVICSLHKCNVVLIPCGHITCSCCANKLTTCYMCRTIINKRQIVFF